MVYGVKKRGLEPALFQLFIDPMDGEAHDVEIGTIHGYAGDIAYPFLNTISAGFVKRPVGSDIMEDLFVRQFGESDIGTIDNRF